MAKTNSLPSVDRPRPNGQVVVLNSGEMIEPVQERPTPVVEGYIPRRVDVKLTRAQAVILRDKLRQLQDSGAKTADGRFVANRTHAVQWILENLPSY